MKCFLCGSNNNLVTIYSLKNKKILRCPNDDLFFAQSNTSPTKLYDSDYYAINPHPSLLKTNQNYFLSKLNKIQQLTKEAKPKILDVGCGWGDFLQVLERKKIPYLGIDCSNEAIRICRRKNLNCRLTDLETLFKNNQEKYSAITCFQVIEHLKNPLPLLQQVKKLLKDNGVIIITTPNNDSATRLRQKHNWSVYNTDSHFVFYNQKNLADVLKAVGFKKVKVTIDQPRFLSLGYLTIRVNELYFNNFFNFLTPLFNFLSFPIKTGKFDDLEAVGIK